VGGYPQKTGNLLGGDERAQTNRGEKTRGEHVKPKKQTRGKGGEKEELVKKVGRWHPWFGKRKKEIN